MSDEREGTVSTTADDTAPTSDSDRSVDAGAESFLSVEADIHATSGGTVRGQAVDVERVPTATVPDDYPWGIGTPDALALTVALADGTEATTYFEFEGGRAGDRLSRLLAVHDIPADRFGDLHGEWLLLTVEGGHYLPVLPAEFPRGDPRGVYGILAGLGLYPLAGVLAIGGGLSLPALVVLLLATSVSLALATYVDAWYLRTRTDWGQGPSFWALLATLPGPNLPTTIAYLWTRRQSEPLA